MGTRRNVKPQTTNVPAKQEKARTQTIPVPDGWYDLNIYDVDPEYHSQTSAAKFVVLKLKLSGSMRYKDRTFNFFIGESMEGSRDDGTKFASARANCIERFGVDPWIHPDQYLDLVVRGHLTTESVEMNNQVVQVNRVVSVYPKIAREQRPSNEDGLQEEIPF